MEGRFKLEFIQMFVVNKAGHAAIIEGDDIILNVTSDGSYNSTIPDVCFSLTKSKYPVIYPQESLRGGG